LIDWGWIGDHIGLIGSRLLQHIELTIIAVLVGFAVSFPVAVFAYRHRAVYAPVTWIAGVLYTIPSLALFVLLGQVTGVLSTTTAEIGLVSYTLLILIRNIVAGLDAVPADTSEAARGMGYSPSQMLWKVQLPLATPVIVAGIRIATVTTIGLVTVTALIGQGGLGYFILYGINQFFSTAIIAGSILSVLLAVAVDALIIRVERRITPWASRSGARAAAG
jgi:osmoprotectant transport system permease protein